MSVMTAPTNAPRYWFARALVFLASFSLMAIELTASRVIAPYVGSSLSTWTAVIGSILLGVTVGSAIGGRLSDQWSARRSVSVFFLAAGLATFCLTTLARWFGPWFLSAEIPFGLTVLLYVALMFFPVAFLLSAVTPFIIKNTLRDLDKTGTTIGTIGAWSALGSILGTFVTGFVFTAFVGVHLLLFVIAFGLLCLSVLAYSLLR